MISNLNVAKLSCTEKRAKKVGEVINGIKMLKFNSWENLLFQEISGIRNMERSFLVRLFFIQGFVRSLTKFMPLIAGLACFWMYSAWKNTPLTIAKAYSLIAIFNGFIDPIFHGLWAFDGLLKARVSNERIKHFLMIDSGVTNNESQGISVIQKGSIEIQNG